MDNINIKEITFTIIDEDSKEHTVKLDNFVNVKDVEFNVSGSSECAYKHNVLVEEIIGNLIINLSLKCDNFELEEM